MDVSDMPICQISLRLSQLSVIDLATQHAQSFNHDVRYSQSYAALSGTLRHGHGDHDGDRIIVNYIYQLTSATHLYAISADA